MTAFDGINFETPDGAKLKARLELRLAELRVRNDDVLLPDRETQANRGAIAEIKHLLSGPMPVVPLQSYNNPGRKT